MRLITSTPPSGAVEKVEKQINQTSHGFNPGDIVYYNGSVYALADATEEHLWMVSEIVNVNEFKISNNGYLTGILGTLVSGTTYYVSDTTPGALVTTKPSTGYEAPIFIADSTNSGYALPYKPDDHIKRARDIALQMAIVFG